MNLVEAYFDESGTHDNSMCMCLAGYVFYRENAVKMTEEWNSYLKEKDVPFFHMTDVALGASFFSKLSKDERIDLQVKCMNSLKRHAKMGLTIILNEQVYKNSVRHNKTMGTAYSFCINRMIAELIPWSESQTEVENISYFFEAGHKSQFESNQIMNNLFVNLDAKNTSKYLAHSFVDKRGVPCLQAADILAWQTTKDVKRYFEGLPMRKDFESILEIPTLKAELTSANLMETFAALESKVPGFIEQYT